MTWSGGLAVCAWCGIYRHVIYYTYKALESILLTITLFITTYWKGSSQELFWPLRFKFFVCVLNLPKTDQPVDWIRSKNCPRISQPLKSHTSRTRQSITLISAATSELANPLSSASCSLGLQSKPSGGQQHKPLRYSNTHIHDWKHETASVVVHWQVGVCIFRCIFVLVLECTHCMYLHYLHKHMHMHTSACVNA